MLQHVSWMSALGWYHLLIFGLFVPYLVIRSRQKLTTAGPPLDRMRHFRSTAVMLVMFGTLSVLTARTESIRLFQIQPARLPMAIAAGLVMYVVTVTAMRPRWRRAVERRTRIVHLFMPQSQKERVWWLLVSVLAGISEEITWRGVQVVLLDFVVGNAAVAIVICAVVFGIAHWVQGAKSASIVSIFGLGFHALVWLAGSLYVAMGVHIVYDVAAGLTYGRLGRELGYTLEETRAGLAPAEDLSFKI